MRPLLTVNAGSSSLRLALFDADADEDAPALASVRHESTDAGPECLASLLDDHRGDEVTVVHRIVHGGPRLTDMCRLDDDIRAEIARLAALAPLHNPVALTWHDRARDLLGPATLHLAVFDTAFFAGLPAVARHYALPLALAREHGLHRYGFHGLAHAAMLAEWQRVAPASLARGGRVISLQLGAGASITASAGGRPLDTSMGFSPLEGLVMATRCGDLDPGLMLHLQRTLGLDAVELDALLNERSGLLGLSGSSGDVRTLLASSDPRAHFALEVQAYRARKYVGAYLAVLGGVDAILVGGGVGEHQPGVRAAILGGFEWAGIVLDATANDAVRGGRTAAVHAARSVAAIHVVAVDEARAMAASARRWLRHAATNRSGASGTDPFVEISE